MYGIYKVTIKDKHYIGSSKDLHSRMSFHEWELTSGRHPKKEMQDYYNKHNSVEINILKTLRTDSELMSWENYFIGMYDSLENGFNGCLGRKGVHITDDVDLNVDSQLLIKDSNDLLKEIIMLMKKSKEEK